MTLRTKPPVAPRPIPSPTDVRALLAATRDDRLLYAGVSLLAFTGLRRGEVGELNVADYEPTVPRLRVTGSSPRTIRIAPSAATALDAYLADQVASPDEPLLLGLQQTATIGRLVSRATETAGVSLGIHDLRRAAMAAVLDDGTPVSHVEAYFGLSRTLGRKDLTPISDGYDVGIAAALETTFSG
ncbi:tyrosine-type recombinase/integrase [Streptomyces sp. NPDC087850]|uniref:tyrosine-type recombinase/integrase n=1 Tax=Streptomyces sp. NPDC087850 TaxID=3365809 RepID=UPI00382C9465